MANNNDYIRGESEYDQWIHAGGGEPQVAAPGYLCLLRQVGEKMPDTATQLADIIDRRDNHILELMASHADVWDRWKRAERRCNWATMAAGLFALAFWIVADIGGWMARVL